MTQYVQLGSDYRRSFDHLNSDVWRQAVIMALQGQYSHSSSSSRNDILPPLPASYALRSVAFAVTSPQAEELSASIPGCDFGLSDSGA